MRCYIQTIFKHPLHLASNSDEVNTSICVESYFGTDIGPREFRVEPPCQIRNHLTEANQLRNLLAKVAVNIMQPLLHLFGHRHECLTELFKHPPQRFHFNNNKRIRAVSLVHFSQDSTNFPWEDCQFNCQETLDYFGRSSPNIHCILPLLLGNLFGFLSDLNCATRRAMSEPRHCGCRDHSCKPYCDRDPVRQLPNIVRKWTKLHPHKSSHMSERILP